MNALHYVLSNFYIKFSSLKLKKRKEEKSAALWVFRGVGLNLLFSLGIIKKKINNKIFPGFLFNLWPGMHYSYMVAWNLRSSSPASDAHVRGSQVFTSAPSNQPVFNTGLVRKFHNTLSPLQDLPFPRFLIYNSNASTLRSFLFWFEMGLFMPPKNPISQNHDYQLLARVGKGRAVKR